MSSAGLRPPERLFLRYPHELSGGQRQRVLIAGALAMAPQLLVADEPVSSLDASIRGEILALLLNLREKLGLGVLVVTHDLGLAWNIADRIAVMYLGRVVEAGPTEEVLRDPQHPYTRALLSVVPEIDQMEPVVLRGEVPDPTKIPPGCRFHPRCPALADGAADAAGVADDCRRTTLEVLPAGGGPPRLLPPRGGPRVEPAVSLQAALPRELYVDDAAWARERERVLSRPGRASDASTTSASTHPAGWPWSTWSVSPSWSRATTTASTRRTTSAATAAPSWSRREPGSEPVCSAAAGAALPLPLVDLLAGRPAAQGAAHRGRRHRPGRLLAAPGRGRGVGGVRVREPHAGCGAVRRRRGEAAANLGNYDMGSLVTGLTLSYDVAANWKVLAENYNECYHCGPVHPELVRLVPAFGGEVRTSRGRTASRTARARGRSRCPGPRTGRPCPGCRRRRRSGTRASCVYPNLMLSCSADHVAAFVLRPVAVDRTRIDCSLLFARDAVAAADFDPSDAGDFWDLVNKQDWAICESVQRGMSSRAYTHGWFAPMEDDSADIRRWLLPSSHRAGR